MKKLLDRAKSTLRDAAQSSSSSSPGQQGQAAASPHPRPDQPSRITPPTAVDVLRYRYHHGTNLGSIFVLEAWLSPSMFPPGGSSDGSELAAVTASLRLHGAAATRSKWEQHWRNVVSDEEWTWLVKSAHCTSIRLPIGYWVLGRDFSASTPFAAAGTAGIYDGAWMAVKAFVARARERGVGVLIDIHGLPGGANGEAHSGTGRGKAELWGNRGNLERATRCMAFVAREVRAGSLEGVVGLQLVNEAVWGATGMFEWYEEVLKVVGGIDASLPVYVSDAWDLGGTLKWACGRRGGGNPVVVDTHKYYTFSDKDRSQAPAEIINRIPQELSELDGKEGSLSDRGEAQVIIGEYSCVLDGQTWNRVRPEEKEGYVRQFGQAQTTKWHQRSGGAYFWTLKMDWMDGGEWGFVEQCKKGNLFIPPSLLLSGEEVRERSQLAQQRRAELAASARTSHEEYWNHTSPGQYFEHEKYSQGWEVGFSDALSFFVMRADGGLGNEAGIGGDRIGCLEIWVKKRMWENGQGGGFVWEWEQGFRAAVRAFNEVVGI